MNRLPAILLRGLPLRALPVLLFVPLAMPSFSISQTFTQEIRKFVGQNASRFLQPVADGFMADVCAGTFTPPDGPGFRIGLQFAVVGAVMREGQQAFLSAPFSTPVEFQYNGVTFLGDLDIPATVLPTAVGMSKSATFTGRLKHIRPKGLPYVPGPYDLITEDATVTIGGTADLPIIPALAPQIVVGSLAATSLTLRYLPRTSLGQAGRIGTFGIGIEHEVGHYLSAPIDIRVTAMYSSIQMEGSNSGTDFSSDASSVLFQAHIAKMFGHGIIKAGPYAVLGLEYSNADISYASADPYLGKQSLNFTSGGQPRFAVGAQMEVFIVAITGEYDVGLVNGFGASAGVIYEFK